MEFERGLQIREAASALDINEGTVTARGRREVARTARMPWRMVDFHCTHGHPEAASPRCQEVHKRQTPLRRSGNCETRGTQEDGCSEDLAVP